MDFHYLCSTDTCTDNENPSGFIFAEGGHSIGVTGTAIVNGRQVNLSSVPQVIIDTQEIVPLTQMTFLLNGAVGAISGAKIVEKLSQVTEKAHATFTNNGDISWTIICEDGYVVGDNIYPPAYGSELTFGTKRKVAYVNYSTLGGGSKWKDGKNEESLYISNGVLNDKESKTRFGGGCVLA